MNQVPTSFPTGVFVAPTVAVDHGSGGNIATEAPSLMPTAYDKVIPLPPTLNNELQEEDADAVNFSLIIFVLIIVIIGSLIAWRLYSRYSNNTPILISTNFTLFSPLYIGIVVKKLVPPQLNILHYLLQMMKKKKKLQMNSFQNKI